MFARRPQTLSAAAAILAVAAVMPGSFGMGGFGTPASRSHFVETPTQAAHWTIAPAARMRATRLTNGVKTLAAELKLAHADKASVSRRLVSLSRARQQALLRLLVRDPGAVGPMILPAADRRVLGALQGARAETKVKLQGRYRIWHHDDFHNPRNDTYLDQLVTRDGKVFTLNGATSGLSARLTFARLKPNARMAIRGYLLAGHVLVTRMRTVGRSLAAAATTVGPLNTAVIAANFSDSATSIDMNALRNLYGGSPGNDVVDYFNQASYGKLQVVPSFFGPYKLAEASQPGCTSFNSSELLQLANADIDYTKFQRVVYVINCSGYGGSASSVGPVLTPDGTVQAAQIMLDSSMYTRLDKQVHELSHTLGNFNMHASMFVCAPSAFTPPTRFDQGCDTAEYGDPFDALGGYSNQASQLDPYHKANAGWFDPGQFPSVTASGTYTVSPYESPTSGVLALNIPRGSSGTAFTVEYRQPIGFDAWMGSSACSGCNVTKGASIRLAGYQVAGAGGGSDTELIDNTPGTIVDSALYYPVSDVNDGALMPGQTFTDPEYGIQITTVSASSSGLTVQVTIPPQTCTRAAPAVTAPSPASQTTSAGQTATYTLTLTNSDSAGCSAEAFRFFPDRSFPDLSVVATPDVVSLAPGASTSVSLSITSRSTSLGGTYGYGSSIGRFISNALGNFATTVPGVTYQLSSAADTTPPTAPTNVAAKPLGSSVVSLSWTPSTDNVGVVGYQILRNGSVFTTATASFLDTALAAGTSYTYSIQAFDRKNNPSSPVTVSVTTPSKTDYTQPSTPIVQGTATDRSITLSWSPATDNVGVAYYQITPCLSVCYVPANTTFVTVTGLTTQTRYDIRVSAVDGDGNYSAMSQYTSAITIYTGVLGDSPPAQPQHLYLPSDTATATNLSWTASAGATAYDVYRNNRKVARVASTSYMDPTGGAHEYYVQAVDSSGSVSAPTPRYWFIAPSTASSDSSPPSGTITSPADGSSVSGTTTITASASDNVAVTRVELYVDGVLQATSTKTPFSFSWDTTKVSSGTHWLYVRAYDGAGNSGTAGVTTVTVGSGGGGGGGGGDNVPPTVSISSPVSGSTVSGAVPVTATASDNVGVTRVQFAVDGSQLATSTSAPYGFTWDASSAAPGSHTITATAFDAAGNSSAASVTISVPVPPDTTPPTVSISSPTNGATISGTAQVQVSASDDVGVAQVTLSVDGTVASTLTASPWTFSIDTTKLVNGGHTLTATASDAAGNSSNAQISVTVQNAPADTTPPSRPSSLRAAVSGTTQVALNWAPSTDNVGVASYDVYRDGALVGQTVLPNYLDSGLTPGTSHVYFVKARDAAGNTSTASSNLTGKTAAVSTSSTGTLAGVVYNSLGRPLANAIVQLTGNGITKSAKTGTNGTFKFQSLPPGQYSLAITPPSTTAAAAAAMSSAAAVVAGTTLVLTTP